MTLSQDTQRILEQVEQVTQKPVQLLPNPALPTLANAVCKFFASG